MRRIDFAVIPILMDASVAITQLMMNLRAIDLGASPLFVGVLTGVGWGLPYFVASLSTGRTVQRVGARRLMLFGGTSFFCSVLAFGLASAPWMLLIAVPFNGLGSACFWPAFQTYLHSSDPEETRRRTGIFSISWTSGILLGCAVSGHLYRTAGPHLAFFISGVVAAATTLLAAIRSGDPEPWAAGEALDDACAGSGQAALHLRLAWLANLSMWVTGTMAATVFPRLGRSAGLGDGIIGEILAAAWVGQAAVFALMGAGSRWHYRVWPLLVGLAVSAVSLALLGWGGGALLFGLGFLGIGASRAPTMYAGLKYGLEAGPSREANMGYHEAIIGGGSVVGPLLGGLLAREMGLRSPYLTGLVIALLVAGLVFAIARARLAPNMRAGTARQ